MTQKNEQGHTPINPLIIRWDEVSHQYKVNKPNIEIEELVSKNIADALVEALKNAGNVLAGLATGQLKSIDRNSPALKQIREALLLAGVRV